MTVTMTMAKAKADAGAIADPYPVRATTVVFANETTHRKLIKGNNRNNTLNTLIRVMLSTKPENFNLTQIDDLINHGAVIYNGSNKNNTINAVLICYLNASKQYYDLKKVERRIMRKSNILQLLDLLIEKGAKSSNSMDYWNSLSLAIRTQDLDIVQKISEMNPRPVADNTMCQYYLYNPENVNCPKEFEEPMVLTLAEVTKNPEIVNIAKSFCIQN